MTRDGKRPDLLRGHVFCALCRRRMSGVDVRRNYRVYRCPSRQTPQGYRGSWRIPAADCERLLWEQVKNILDDSSLIAEELERRKAAGEDTRSKLLADVDAARRELKRVEGELGRLVARAGSADDDLWALFEKEIAGKQGANKWLGTMVSDAEACFTAENCRHH